MPRADDADVHVLPDGETRYRQLFAHMASGFALHEILCDAAGTPVDYRWLEVNPAFERLTGLKARDLIGRRLLEVLPQTEPRWVAFFGRVALTGEPAETEDYSRALDRWYEVRAFCPAPRHFAVIFTEVTERKRMEVALRAREEDLALTLASLSEAVIVTDAAGLITRMNPAAETLTGWPASTALGRPATDIITVEATAADHAAGVSTFVNRHGVLRQISMRHAPRLGPDGQSVGQVFVARDVTEMLLLEEQRRQGQKMDAIGQLAGGIAHDLNNMLGGILGSAEFLTRQVAHDARAERYARLIVTTTERAAGLISRLLAFARHQRLQEQQVELRSIVDDAVLLLGSSLDRRITVTTDHQALDALVLGDAAQLESVVLNLAINGAHAMPAGGTITIATRRVATVTTEHPVFPLRPGPHVVLTVTDTGHGIPPEVLPRIFEPFFTTKGTGHGTGLGLAAVHGTMRQHHGRITLDTSPAGTSFHLWLPEVERTPITTEATTSGAGTGRILVVDDDDTLRTLVADMLTSLGYSVHAVADGAAAVQHLTADPRAINAVVLDLHMPGMSGEACFNALRAVRHDLPIVMASGNITTDIAERLRAAGLHGILPKPYRLSDLSAAMTAACRAPGL